MTVRVFGGRKNSPGPFGHSSRDGRRRVIDSTGPRSIIAPGSPVEITTADNANFQTILNANPGAIFWIRAGTYNRTSSISPLANQTLVFEPGAILDGGDMNDACLIVNAAGVTIRGGKIQNFGTVETGTAGRGVLVQIGGTDCVIEDMEATSCFKSGVALQASGVIVRYCHLHNNGRSGYSVVTGLASGQVITHCEINNNNTALNNPGGEAGAGKTSVDGAVGLVFSHNYVHNEYGFGAWWDFSTPTSVGTIIEENVVEDCLWAGIFYEASGGGAIIRHNYLKGNGAGDASFPADSAASWQILVSCSDGTLGINSPIVIEYNIVDGFGTLGGVHPLLIGLLNHDSHPIDTKNVKVRRNQLWCREAGQSIGGVDNQATKTLWTEASNTFDEDEIHVITSSDQVCRWDSGSGSGISKTFAQFQAFGFEANGTQIDDL